MKYRLACGLHQKEKKVGKKRTERERERGGVRERKCDSNFVHNDLCVFFII